MASIRRAGVAAGLAAAAAGVTLACTAFAQGTPEEAGLPVLSSAAPHGTYETQPLPAVAPTGTRAVDGSIGDWAGTPTRFGGTTVADRGELIYQDHLFDAWGAASDQTAERIATQDQLEGVASEAYRLDALQQADVPGEFGLPAPESLRVENHYGAGPHQDAADLLELRLAADASDVWVLGRTTTMTSANGTGLLLLFDTLPGDTAVEVPFGTGLTSERADLAVLLAGNGGKLADLHAGVVEDLPAGSVATDPSGYVNAIEARIARDRIGGAALGVAAVTGSWDGGTLTPANVAFRTGEPAREYFDKKQALALHAGSVDGFFAEADLGALASGRTERFVPGPGYHERIFVSTESISNEGGKDGIHQRYGLYLPQAYQAGTPNPLQYWLHFRGGEAHTAANLVPRVFEHYGEDRDTVVVTPHARGSSSWYAGKGHVDFLEVWDDVLETVSVDQSRVYVSGHSMGGYGTYLLTTLYPDRFAAGMPVAGPPTQGMWTGVEFDGCEQFTYEEYSPCYTQANDGDAEAQNTYRLLDNLRNVPLAIWHGTNDELVPVSGVTRQAARLQELGYTYRYYVFPGYEHYSHPAMDEWAAGARYMHGFTRDATPHRVTYVRDMRFERATETSRSGGVPLDFDFDSAYWMSKLEPADPDEGVARFDGTTGMRQRYTVTQAVPDSGPPTEFGTTGPFTILGQREVSLILPQDAAWNPSPDFDLNVTGARSVQIDMRELDMFEYLDATVTTDGPLEIAFAGTYEEIPDVTGAEIVGVADGVLTLRVPEGTTQIAVRP